jgi:4-amino-4-deoxy-L-arabinose transferase-like glycosyltransferase
MQNTGNNSHGLSVITPTHLLFGWLLCAFLWAQLAAIPHAAPTVDEQNHLARGWTIWRTGDYRLLIGHPPLLNLLNALPVLPDTRIQFSFDRPEWARADWIEVPISLFWKLDNPALAMIYAGRVMTVLLGVLLLAALFRLGADVGGRWAGVVMVALAVLDPNLRAHARLITTDLGLLLALALTLLVWRRWLRHPRPRLTIAAGVLLGLALASKFSALLYAAAFCGLAALRWRFEPRALGRIAVALTLAVLVLWGTYRFELRPLTGNDGFPVPLANYVEDFAVAGVVIHQPNYLLGQVNPSFDWLYFPIAILVKTPLPLLGLSVYGLWRWLRKRWRAELLWWAPALAYLGFALFSEVYIGYRHLFPILPLTYLGAALGALGLWQRAQAGRWIVSGLFAWLVLSTAGIYPRDLTFFNETIGGPDNGWRVLVDSNLDWGQDLGELVDYVRDNKIESLYLSYFGAIPVNSIPVREYPLPVKALPPRPAPDWYPPFPAPGWYAISLNHLVGGAGFADPDIFAYFRRIQPVAVLGRTIYIYHVPAESGAVAVCADPLPALGEPEARKMFGAALTRWLQFDCSRGLPLPTGLTWYVLNETQRAHVSAVLTSLGARELYSDQPMNLNVFRVEDAAAQASTFSTGSIPAQRFGDLASLLGYRYREPWQAGQAAQVQTVWRLEAPLPEPVSIFFHLVAPDGFPLEIADGFNTPFDQLQAGDGLIQFHSLTLPATLQPGSQFQVGLYALFGAQTRYRLPDGSDAFCFEP